MRRPDYYRSYYAANREKILARCKKWRTRNRARRNEIERAWREANPEKVRAKYKRYRLAHQEERRAKDRARAKEMRKEDPEKCREKDRLFRIRKKARMAADPELRAHFLSKKRAAKKRYDARLAARCARDADRYAKERMCKRVSYAKKMVRAGRPYRPLPSRRIPDWATKDERILDTRSQFLADNITDSQRAYARELAIERKERRARG